MRAEISAVIWALSIATATAIHADELKLAPKPVLRIDAEGPLSSLTSLAFRQDVDPKEATLFAAGLDKTIHAWSRVEGRKAWDYDRGRSLRVPIAPGAYGSLNAMALSADGEWLATAGRGVMRGLSNWEEEGLIRSALDISPDMLLDIGTILVFHLPTGKAHRLRGHTGSVRALTFASGVAPDAKPILISGAIEMPSGTGATLRAWNLDNFRELNPALVLKEIPDGNRPLGLAAWRTGPQPDSIRVAAAWGDGKLRVWDVATNQVAVPQLEIQPNTISALPGDPLKLLAGAPGKVAALTIGDLAGAKSSPNGSGQTAEQKLSFKVAWLPRAVTAVARPASAAGVLAAWIIMAEGQQRNTREFWLVLVDVKTGIEKRIRLWGDSRVPPVIAADPSGQFLAVAGNEQHEVWVFQVDDVWKERSDKQVLRSVAQTVRYASFAKREGRLGLVLSETLPGSPKREAKFFDFSQRRLLRLEQANAIDFSADRTGWDIVEVKSNQATAPPSVEVRNARQRPQSINLDPGDHLTAGAVLPTHPIFKNGLLAVAVQHENEPWLILYNLATRERLCLLNGHEAVVEWAGFSRDGKYLASVARDNTVCLWWLDDLPQLTQSRGAINDLVVDTNAAGQLVVKVDRPGRFARGDLLTVVEKNAEKSAGQTSPVKAFGSAHEFWFYVAQREPGKSLVVDVIRATGRKEAGVNVAVERALPERRPLCSLFLSKDPQRAETDWIAWDPLGVYDASGADAERRLGWLFNTEERDLPVKFAAVEEYREQNRRPGLIYEHLEHGPRLVPRPPPEPGLSLLFREDQQPLVSKPGVTVVARGGDLSTVLQLQDFPERLIDRVRWQTGTVEGNMRRITEGLWETDLETANLGREASLVSVKLETKEHPPREFSTEAMLQIVPPAPILVVEPDIPEVADAEQLKFSVLVRNAVNREQEPVVVKIVHTHAGQTVAGQEWEFEPGKALPREITLLTGNNTLTVTAWNKNARPDTRMLEQTRKSWSIRLPKPQIPEVLLLGVVRPAEQAPTRLAPGEAWQTDCPRIDVRGKMTVDPPDFFTRGFYVVSEKPSDGDSSRGDLPKVDLHGFQKKSAFDFTQSISLVPGMQTVTITGMTNRGTEALVAFRVNFTPALPTIKSFELTLAGGAPVPIGDLLIEGRHEPRVTAELHLVSPPRDLLVPHDAALELRVKSSAETKTEKVVVKSPVAAQAIRKELTLRPGVNEISISLRNEWGSEIELPLRTLVFKQPPRILRVAVPQEAMTAEVALEAEIESKTDQTRVSVLANGVKIPQDRITWTAAQNAKHLWRIAVPVPLQVNEPQTTLIELFAWNRDGESLDRHQSVTKYVPPPPKVPIIEVVNLARTKSHQLAAEFRVRSSFPLEEVRTRITASGGKVLETRIPISADAVPDASGFLTFRHEWPLATIDDPKFEFTVEARNQEGTSWKGPIERNFPPEPLRISSIKLRPAGGARDLSRKPGGFRVQHFETAPKGSLVLDGDLGEVPDSKDPLLVKIWVNGFMQSTARVQHGKSTFSSAIALNVSKSNRITFELPHAPAEEHGIPTLILDCNGHLPPPKLRLLTVVAGGSDAPIDADAIGLLHHRIVKALEARAGQAIDFKIVPYLLAGGFNAQDFNSNLTHIARAMLIARQRTGAAPDNELDEPSYEPFNEVVLVYYAGSSIADNRQFALRTGDPGSAITQNSLSRLHRMPGAHLLLLDIENQENARPETALTLNPRLGVGVLRVVASRRSLDAPQPDRFRLVAAMERTFEQSSEAELSLKEVNSRLKSQLDTPDKSGVFFLPEIPTDLQELVLKR